MSGIDCVDTLRKMGFRVTSDDVDVSAGATEHGGLVGLQRGRRMVVVPRVDALTPIQLHMVLAQAGVAESDFRWYLRAPAWRFFGMAVEAGLDDDAPATERMTDGIDADADAIDDADILEEEPAPDTERAA